MKLTVNASKKYDVVSYADFKNLSEETKKVFSGKKILIVTDDNVSAYYLEEVKSVLTGYDLFTAVLPAGEATKTVATYLSVVEKLAENGFTRSDAVLALGGGVVGDIAGFAAATYMRGIGFIQCPTSFLAMIDSSVGGKTAVDLPQGKNLLGAFYQPDLVYISLSVLRTLPEREVVCGMGEAVKYAFLSGTVTEEMLKKGMSEELIFTCLSIKSDVVEGDEFDKGRRAFLNLGHTIGHAIEKLSRYSLSHGECVAKGIAQIIRMSARYYRLSDVETAKMNALLALVKTDVDPVFSLEEILKETVHDKKKENAGVKFVLIKRIGEVESVLFSEEEAKRCLL